MYYFALPVFWGRLGAVISSTCCDDDLRRSVFLDANSTYARVLLYPSTNGKILIPTKLGVGNARLAFFYSSARRREKCCLLESHTCPAGSVNVSQQSKYSIVRQTYFFNFHNPLQSLSKPSLLRPGSLHIPVTNLWEVPFLTYLSHWAQ